MQAATTNEMFSAASTYRRERNADTRYNLPLFIHVGMKRFFKSDAPGYEAAKARSVIFNWTHRHTGKRWRFTVTTTPDGFWIERIKDYPRVVRTKPYGERYRKRGL